MPYKPRRPCAINGCPNLVDSGSSYCAEHQKAVNKHYNQYKRDPESNKRYGRTWKEIRKHYIETHPLCEECKRYGRLTPAEEVHHIKPLAEGGSHETSNLMSLCKSCHSRITATTARWGEVLPSAWTT